MSVNRFNIHPTFRIPIFSISYSIVHQVLHILPPKYFHSWLQYHCLISSGIWILQCLDCTMLPNSPFPSCFSSILSVANKYKPNEMSFTSNLVLDLHLNLLLISFSFLLHYSLSHPQLQLALQTWPLAFLSAYFGDIQILLVATLCFKSYLCLKLSWSSLDLDKDH